MAFLISDVPGVSWLHLGAGVIRQPLERSIAVGAVDLGLGGPSRTRFLMAQDQAVQSVTSAAATTRAAIAQVDFPQGDQIALMQVANPSRRSWWTGQAESRAERTTYLSRVANLAQSQTVISAPQGKPGQESLAAGEYVLKLTVGDEEPHYLDITIDYSEPFPDSATDVLRRIGRAVEAADERLTTQLVYDTALDDNGLTVTTVALAIQTRQAGAGAGFTLEDVSGDLAATLELGASLEAGQDLVYLMGTRRATPYEVLTSDYGRGPVAGSLTPRWPWRPALAEAQINQSVTLVPSGTADLPAGTYQFKVSQGGRSAQVTFTIDYRSFAPDDNQAILERLAGEIAGAQAGLQAEASTGEALTEADQVSQGTTLVVASRGSTADQEFRLEDVAGDLIHRLGLDRIRRPLSPTPPEVVGRANDRSSDRFSLDATQVATQARQPFMDEPAKLTVAPAEGAIVDRVTTAAAWYDYFQADLQSKRAYLNQSVGQSLTSELLRHQADYAAVGLDVAGSGYVSVGEGLAAGLERDVEEVRQSLAGAEGFLTIVDERLGRALAIGFDQYRLHRPGEIYNAAGVSGFDPFARAYLAAGGAGRRTSLDRRSWLMSQLI